ncbi:DNA-3-methyladenine glycosylase I [Plantibacter flavus]|uniref:DNA-3-methyladenine glycosylase I n=1 Tax=Plantibacter flavus TaxID=150123 RepID=UPI003F1410E9
MTAPTPLVIGDDTLPRCAWVGTDPEYQRYHDEEWGVALHGTSKVFEKMSLEGFQAGLSWITILRKRPAFRERFHAFDLARVAAMTEDDVRSLLQDARIIRHRGKIEAVIGNARTALEHGDDLDEILWSFQPAPRATRFSTWAEVPAVTEESTALSKHLKRRGYRFVGPTTMYALMQSAGLVDDHFVGCWRAQSQR